MDAPAQRAATPSYVLRSVEDSRSAPSADCLYIYLYIYI